MCQILASVLDAGWLTSVEKLVNSVHYTQRHILSNPWNLDSSSISIVICYEIITITCEWESWHSLWFGYSVASYNPWITFDLHFISDLLVSTRDLRLWALLGRTWFSNPLVVVGWRFHNHLPTWMRRGHLNSHEGWLCPVTGSSALVIVNSVRLNPVVSRLLTYQQKWPYLASKIFVLKLWATLGLLAWPKVSKKNSALTLGKGRSNMMLIILVKMGEREREI